MILFSTTLRDEGGYGGVPYDEDYLGVVVNFKRICDDSPNGTLHWTSPSGKVTYG